MNLTSATSRTLVLVAVCLFLGRSVVAQRPEVSVGYVRVTSAGDGVGGDCFYPETRNVFSGRVRVPLRSTVSAAVNVRTPWSLNTQSNCVSAPLPPNITIIRNDRVDLLTETYTATDARLGVRVGTTVALQLDVGGGKAWRPERDDIPYILATAQLLVRLVPRLHVTLEVTHERLRITNDPVRETYREGRLVSADPLGRSRRWSHAASIGIMLGVSL